MKKDELEAKGYYTINKLMELTGSDRRTIAKKLKGEEPDHTYGGNGYYELNRVMEILDESLEKETSEKAKLECEKLISQIRNIDLRNDALAQRLIPASDIANVWTNHIARTRQVLISIEDLAPVLVGLDANEIKAKLKECSVNIIKELNECPTYDEESREDT